MTLYLNYTLMVVRIVWEVLGSLFGVIGMPWNLVCRSWVWSIGELAKDGVYCLTLDIVKLAIRW